MSRSVLAFEWAVGKVKKLNKDQVRIVKPSINVFTVGMDEKVQIKSPLECGQSPPSPPPSYCAKQLSQELGTPIIIKKKSSFKTPLIWLLAIFLIAFFTLTLSEIAYNRQRDEKFFRLRWAELKHRMGFDQQRSNNVGEGPFFNSLRRNDEFTNRIVPVNSAAWRADRGFKVEEVSTTTTTTTTTTAAPSTTSEASNLVISESTENDAQSEGRLTFLRNILQKIKQHAEDMGMEGTMQVSVIRVDPMDETKENDSTESVNINKPIFEPPRFNPFRNNNNEENNNNRQSNDFPAWQKPQPTFFNRFNSDSDEEETEKSNEQQNVGDYQKRRFGQMVQDIIAQRIHQAVLMNAIARQQQMAQMEQNEFYNRQQNSFSPFMAHQQQHQPLMWTQQQQQPQQWQQQPESTQSMFLPAQQQKMDFSADVQQNQQPSDAFWNRQINENQQQQLNLPLQNQAFNSGNEEEPKKTGNIVSPQQSFEGGFNKQTETKTNGDLFPVRLAVANDDPTSERTIQHDSPIFHSALFQVDEPSAQMAAGSA
uniref:Uncharacterized protein n=1 Tax=Rhabditophanes sp. KR3021 TaxID=114890 RepID=A0AC35U636_9BILA